MTNKNNIIRFNADTKPNEMFEYDLACDKFVILEDGKFSVNGKIVEYKKGDTINAEELEGENLCNKTD